MLAAVRVQKLLGSADKSACEKKLLDVVGLPGADPEAAQEVLETLKAWRSGEVGAFKKAAGERWPRVTRLA